MKYKVMGYVIQWLLDGNWNVINYINFNKIDVEERLLQLKSKYPNDEFRLVDLKMNERFLSSTIV